MKDECYVVNCSLHTPVLATIFSKGLGPKKFLSQGILEGSRDFRNVNN